MRFMIIVRANAESEAASAPVADPELLTGLTPKVSASAAARAAFETAAALIACTRQRAPLLKRASGLR